MSQPADRTPVPGPEETSDEATGVPRIRTWRGVYLLVLVWFVVVVALLALFTHAFS